MRRRYLAALCLISASVTAEHANAQKCAGPPPIPVKIIVESPHPDVPLPAPIKLTILRVGNDTPSVEVLPAKGEVSENLGVGQYKISAIPTQFGWGPETKFITLGASDTERIVRIQIHYGVLIRSKHPPPVAPIPVPIKVLVTDPIGTPIPNATLNFIGPEDSFVRTVTTDANGEYAAKESPGDLEINVLDQGFAMQTQKVMVRKDEQAEQSFHITLRPADTFSPVCITVGMLIGPKNSPSAPKP